MSFELAVTDAELAIVREILRRLVPPGYRAYAFGSRATGLRLKPSSDLDLAIEGPERLPWGVTGDLEDAFDESLLRWKVDVVDLATASDWFRVIVEQDRVELEFRSPGPTLSRTRP